MLLDYVDSCRLKFYTRSTWDKTLFVGAQGIRMNNVKPEFSRTQVNRAGEVLIDPEANEERQPGAGTLRR